MLKTKIFISVVSHEDEDLVIHNLSKINLCQTAVFITVGIIDNVGRNEDLKQFALRNGHHFYCDRIQRGYGANHNLNFNLLKPDQGDYFLVLNPDVCLVDVVWDTLLLKVDRAVGITGVKVYESLDKSIFSSHARQFPALLDPFVSLLFHKKLFEMEFNKSRYVDWIGGAFMCFTAECYRKLGGFDEKYFMYYEDIDICQRAKRLGYKVYYNASQHIVHEARREGRSIFSRHFIWNLQSMIKYFCSYPTMRLLTLKRKNEA